MAVVEKKNKQGIQAVEEIEEEKSDEAEDEEKMAEENSTGQREFIKRLDKGMNLESGRDTPEPKNLPICTRTPRTLITGKSPPALNDYASNYSKYLRQQRSGMS